MPPTRVQRPSARNLMRAEAASIGELASAIAAGRVTATAVTEACLARIEARNPVLNAFISVQADDALRAAHAADAEIARGASRGPLHGVPISLKDLIDVRGVPTTAASRVREHHVARADARVVVRLREAGAVLIGKTNLHEFAFGTTNEESGWGPARHPEDPTRSPGGSSGGSAISVAEGMAWASVGTDTGGSIRIPAAACGLVGLKPSLGEVPTSGIVPLSHTMDHVGPLCRTVDDAALLFDLLRGERPRARSGSPAPGGLRLGVPAGHLTARLEPAIRDAFASVCDRLQASGVTIEHVAIPHAGDVGPIYLHIGLSEAAAFHASSLERTPELYTPGVRMRLELGRYVLAEDYVRALIGRDTLIGEVDRAVCSVDALLLPSLAVQAPVIGTATVTIDDHPEPVRSLMLRQTQLFNVTGHPAVTLPCDERAHGLPVGIQLVGRLRGTDDLLDVARTVAPLALRRDR